MTGESASVTPFFWGGGAVPLIRLTNPDLARSKKPTLLAAREANSSMTKDQYGKDLMDKPTIIVHPQIPRIAHT